jgi:FixJ family two-component response regulator
MKDDLVDYIPKPFKPSEVAEHIEAMLDPKRREEVAKERTKREAKLHTIVNIMHRNRD